MSDKIITIVTVANCFKFDGEYGTVRMYLFEDNDNNVFLWKTSTEINVHKGDVVKISATVKGVKDYKGTLQTVIQRVKILETIRDYTSQKSAEQYKSISDGDIIWTMEYSRYKNHYSDCETIVGSYDSKSKSISVIIRKGRMVNSGTRGKHYSGYQFKLSNSFKITFRAVSEDNAKKQLLKLYPDEIGAECIKIFKY